MTTYKFKAVYKRLGIGYNPTSAPVCTIVDSNDNILVSAQPATALINLPGLYIYSYTGADDLDLVGLFHTDDVLTDEQDLYSYIPDIIIDIKDKTDNLPAFPADETLLEAILATLATPADVNVSIAISEAVAIAISTGMLAIEAGYTFLQTITSTLVEDLSSATKLWLAIKSRTDVDANSIIFLEKTDGLTIVNKTAYTQIADGSVIVSGSSGAWEIEIHIDEVATSLLFDKVGRYDAGLKAKIGDNELSIWEGQCSITDGVIRTI